MSWLFLAVAVAAELAATMALRASGGLRRKRWAPAVVVGYLVAFMCLSIALRHGMTTGIALIATGVLLVELGSH